MNKVVITGIGTVNALGQNSQYFLEELQAGRSAIDRISGFDTQPFRSKLGAEVKGFEPSRFVDPMKLRRMDKLSQMVLVSSIEAMKDAGLSAGILPPERIGVVIGNGYGGTSCTEEFFEGLLMRGPMGVNPMLFPTTVPNSAASLTSIELRLKGPNCTFCQKDISAEEAVIYAVGLIRKGAADAVIAGGGEELNDVIYHAFDSLRILSPGRKGGEEGSFPFGRGRNGRILGEGAGVLVLESLESADRRGARIYAEIAGEAIFSGRSGVSSYGRNHIPATRAMGLALAKAGVPNTTVDYISSSANSTPDLDELEVNAIKDFFGQSAHSIPLSTIKPMTGDFEGMGGVRLVASVLAIENSFIPPTLNQDDPEKWFNLDCVPNQGREAILNNIMHLAIGNGGSCACMILKKLIAA
ncbi:MAG: beta-ketoacyl-[acyl-carrier-protein] synthase family protein [Nitrospirota bacterium]